MKFVFATNNLNKIKEIQQMVPKNIQLLSLSDIGCAEEIPETQNTIKGNAVQKATYISKKYGYNCFADDTGLEVDVLNGAPGVYSARYAGAQKNDTKNIDKLLAELDGKLNRKAQFKTVVALCINNEMYSFTGICQGSITKERYGAGGFGYDSVFMPEGFQETFAQISLQEKNRISHRGKAIFQLIQFLCNYSIK